MLSTGFAPDIKNKILFLEEHKSADINIIKNNLNFLVLNKNFNKVKGIVFGRINPDSKVDEKELKNLLKKIGVNHKIPIIYGLDFGHTSPRITFPIGGMADLDATNTKPAIIIKKH